MCEKYPIIKRSSESRKGFPFLKEINPLHLFTDKKEFLVCLQPYATSCVPQTTVGFQLYLEILFILLRLL